LIGGTVLGISRPDQRQLIEMRVWRRRHNRAVRRAAGVVLHVDPERLAKMSDFQSSGDAHVVFGIGVHQVAAAAENEGSLRLKSPHVLADQEQRLESLAQPLVHFDGASVVAIRIFVPEKASLVAGPDRPSARSPHVRNCEAGSSINGHPSPTALRTPMDG
jgi:hypothetical protein